MEFVKMHGLGNDFLIFQDLQGSPVDWGALARNLCRRRWSVGADGLAAIQPSAIADFRMRIFNPDGSEAEMCGNALRCTALYLKKYLGSGAKLNIETGLLSKGTSIKETVVLPGGMVRVDMGRPLWESALVPVAGPDRKVINEEIQAGDRKFRFSAVNMGNPHCVIFVEQMDDALVEEYGPLLEKHPCFPEKTNVEFVKKFHSGKVTVMVWERGAGRTLACGTGACAVVAAGAIQEILDYSVEVTLPGGALRVEWHPKGNVFMEGPAEEVFSGRLPGCSY